MSLKTPLVGMLCLLVGAAATQGEPAGGCGTDLTPELAGKALELEAAGAYDPVVIPRTIQLIPMTFHVVRSSSGAGGIGASQIAQALADVNDAYFSVGMEFFQAGPLRYVDDSNFYFSLNTRAEADALRQVDPVPGTINVYFAPSLYVTQSLCGLSSFTFEDVQGIIMVNGCSGVPDNSSTFAHEIGHYFDLYHTHEVMFGAECPNESNCTYAGDLVCDTPADPGLNEDNVTACEFNNPVLRLCYTFYNPDPSNIMSFAPESCRTVFTAGQAERMWSTLENLRPELLDYASCPGDVTGDEFVGLDDLQALLFNFGAAQAETGDADGDGDVDLDDLQLLLFNFGNACAM